MPSSETVVWALRTHQIHRTGKINSQPSLSGAHAMPMMAIIAMSTMARIWVRSGLKVCAFMSIDTSGHGGEVCNGGDRPIVRNPAHLARRLFQYMGWGDRV